MDFHEIMIHKRRSKLFTLIWNEELRLKLHIFLRGGCFINHLQCVHLGFEIYRFQFVGVYQHTFLTKQKTIIQNVI